MAIPYGQQPFLVCLNREWQQGLVSSGLYEEFRNRWSSAAHGGPNAMNSQARANAIIEDMKVTFQEERRRALLQWQATRRIAEAMRSYRNRKGMLDAGEFALEMLYSNRAHDSSVEGRSEALFGHLTDGLQQAFLRFRRSDLTGMQRHLADLHDVIRELDGQQTQNPVARAFALAWQQSSEQARRMFNAAGGNIPRIDRWIMPQMHNPAKVEHAGFAAWSAYVTPRLDVARMIDGRTGGPLNPADLQDALHEVYVSITTQGRGHADPQLRGGGQGSLALQRLDHRFLAFKDADSWIQYQREYGSGGLVDVMFSHIRSMAKDIAAMQMLGPNPGDTIDWMKQTINNEMMRAARGEPDAIFPEENGHGDVLTVGGFTLINGRFDEMANPNGARTAYAKAKSDALTTMWDVYTGAAHIDGSEALANAVGTSKNVFMAAALGSTSVLAAFTDPVTTMLARAYAGMPVHRAFTDYLRAMGPGGRAEALEASIINESMMNTMMTEMRFIGPVFGKSISRWLLDRTMVWSLLKGHTAAAKNGLGLTAVNGLASMRNLPWADLNNGFRGYLERYGMGAADWDAIRSTPTRTTQRGLEIIHPNDIATFQGPAPAVRHRAGLTPRQELALRVREMIRTETELAVPSGNLRTQRMTTAATGMLRGAFWTSISTLKSFTLSVHMGHMYRVFEMLRSDRIAPAAAYLAWIVAGGTVGGFIAVQLVEMKNGRYPRKIDDIDAWKEGLMKGASLGFFSDVLQYGEDADGKDMIYRLLGPLADQLASALSVGASAVDQIGDGITGQETDSNTGREAMSLLKKITPFSTIWYSKLAMDRWFWDNIQRQIDPQADDAFERRRAWYEENKQQGYWWAPGQEPDLSRLPK